MKSKAIALLLASALAGTSVGAFAQGGPGPDDHRGPDQHGGPQGGPPHGGPQGGPHGGPQMHADDHGGRPPVPHQDWRRGERLPQDYRDNRYVVNDWHSHGLRQPPRGYEWRQVNGDYVLAAVATGVISSIILSTH